MNFGQSFSFPFQDRDWARKLLIPGLIGVIGSIIIIGPIFLVGWGLDVTRRIIRHEPEMLPELDFGRQMVDGLKALVVSLVYSIPVFIFIIPIIIVAVLSGNSSNNQLSAPAWVVTVCCSGLIIVYAILMAFVLPAAFANMVAHDDNIGSGLQFREVFALVRAAPGAYLIALAGQIVSNLVSSLVGGIACGVGVILTLPYAMAVNGHLYGQAYNEAKGNEGFARVY